MQADAANPLRDLWKSSRQRIIERFRSSGRTAVLLKGLRMAADDCLKRLFVDTALSPGYCLVAVGGYGRGELFPSSDIDVLLLVPQPMDELPAPARESVERFVTACWDIGMEIGFSVRSIDECVSEAQKDVTVQTALLEARRITGSVRLFQSFQTAYGHALDAQQFYRAKLLELRQRHTKYEDTPYSLEPNCKESPGGLRDLHFLLWTANAAGLGNHWDAMAARGLLTA
ncbi:MAG: nucleotidyltransferase domain-containing protein, partial [Betaproteobacteria bacterium]|nr:nucleotidyltransferase domain-containing protein [Betaproteobacteria bacterium]